MNAREYVYQSHHRQRSISSEYSFHDAFDQRHWSSMRTPASKIDLRRELVAPSNNADCCDMSMLARQRLHANTLQPTTTLEPPPQT